LLTPARNQALRLAKLKTILRMGGGSVEDS
jgi:hypothetical protein